MTDRRVLAIADPNAAGRKSAVYGFPALLNIAEGRDAF